MTAGSTELSVVLLDRTIEDTLRDAIARTSAGSFLTLAPAAARDVIAAIRAALALVEAPARPLILTQPDIRRFVRKLIEPELGDVIVVSCADLLPEISLRTLATARLAAG